MENFFSDTNENRMYIAVAGDHSDNLPLDVWKLLSSKGFADGKSVDRVGFLRDTQSNRMIVVFPKAYAAPRENGYLNNKSFLVENIYQLIRLMSRISRETNYSQEYIESNIPIGETTERTDPVLDSLEAALRLRSDFIRNGPYLKKSRYQQINARNHPINWKRTVLNNFPVLSSDSEVLFIDTIHNLRLRNNENLLYKLHLQCVREISLLTGERDWIKTYNGLEPYEYARIKSNPRPIIRFLSSRTFDQRGISLLKLISAYLNESRLVSSSMIEEDNLLSYTSSFELIWEFILRRILQPANESRNLPAGKWRSQSIGQTQSGIRPQIDVHVKTQDHEVLLDAKDYQIFNGSYLGVRGSSSDHYKQIIYRKLMTQGYKNNFYNILAFPSFGGKNFFNLKGCHFWTEMDGSEVYEIEVDYEKAVKYWLGELQMDIPEEISKLLTKIGVFESHKL